MKKHLLSPLILVAGFTSVAPAASPRPMDFLAAHLDAAVKPGVDFFDFANGGWLKGYPIPPSESAWGIGNEVKEQLYTSLRRINEDAASQKSPSADMQKVGDFWTTAMDEAKAERLGLAPIAGELARVAEVKSAREALDLAFSWGPLGVDAFFSFGISQDEKHSEAMAVHLSQGGLGLPERDFYFNPETGVARIRAEYIAHIGRCLKLLGQEEPASRAAAERVMAFETELARASRRLEELRDPLKNYNPMAPREVTAKLTPSILWEDRLGAWGIHPSSVIVGQPEFYGALEGLLARTPASVLQDYLRFHLVDAYGDFLNQAWEKEQFAFHGRVLSGKEQPRERWRRVLDAQESAMGMVLGKVFVQAYFPEATKQRYSDMVEAIRLAYRERIERLDWMSPATKAKAQAKLAAMSKKVGYPDKWKDYSALAVSRNSYCENMMNAARWSFRDRLSKLDKPVDRSEWSMTPQTYNAYYNPSNNEIVLPAAIFTVPGQKDADLDDAVVYGYVGASTIGHEITHGFDDEGRMFDAKGNLTDWWTPEDAQKFQSAGEVMVRQFSAYEPLPGLHINGKASLGENIADFGGLELGLDAFKKTDQYRKGEKIGGLTPLQRYFLGYALGWLHHQREEVLRTELLGDVHAPAKWRVLGPLSNIPDFYQAFGVTKGQPMWRPAPERVKIW